MTLREPLHIEEDVIGRQERYRRYLEKFDVSVYGTVQPGRDVAGFPIIVIENKTFPLSAGTTHD